MAAQLEAWGITAAFGVVGDTIAPLVKAISDTKHIRCLTFRHEEAAAFAASAYAKLTGKIAVCFADAGPGAVRLLNGAYDAFQDSVPLLALTGQSPQRHLFTAYHQTGDMAALFSHATTYSATIASPEHALIALQEALQTAYASRTAVHLSVPVDLQQQPLQSNVIPPVPGAMPPLRNRPYMDEQAVADIAKQLQAAQQPLILFGQSAWEYAEQLRNLAEALNAPMIHTLPATGVIPHDHPLLLGVLGDAGNPVTRTAMDEADTVLVLGSSWWPPGYTPGNATILQIDRSPERIGLGGLKPSMAAIADLRDALPALLEHLSDHTPQQQASAWRRQMEQAKQDWLSNRNVEHKPHDGTRMHPHDIMMTLSESLPEDMLITLDVGAHTLWFGASFQAKSQQVLVSGMWRSMGYAIPAALAGRVVSPQRPIAAIVGDGGFAMSMAEVITSMQYNLPVLVIVLNNDCLAQEQHAQEKMGIEPVGVELINPDFAELARSMGARGVTVRSGEELAGAVREGLQRDTTTVIDVRTLTIAPPEMARQIRQQPALVLQ